MNHLTVENYWTLAGFAVVCALLTLAGFFSRLRRDRIFADTPLVKIRSAAQGYVRLEGRAEPPPGETITAPLSGRTCVWWDYRVEVKETGTKGESTYRTVDQATSVTPFVLTDTDAECLVGPIGAEVTPTSRQSWSGEGVRPTVQSALQSPSNGAYRCYEQLITAGTRLTVLGDLRSHTEFGATDQKTREILAQWKGDQRTLLAKFDRNHDGKIDPAEWEAARAAAHAEAEATVLHSPIERVGVVGQTTHGQPFVIAPLEGKNLVRREKQYALAYLAASVLCVGFCIWSLGKAQHLQQAQNIRANDQASDQASE